jgi:hypothetical protein
VLSASRDEHHESEEMLFVALPHDTGHDTEMVGKLQQPESQVGGRLNKEVVVEVKLNSLSIS